MDTMGIDVLIDSLSEVVQNARGVPFSSDKCMVDRSKILDLLDEMVETLPEDMKKARSIVSSRNEMINQARSEAEATINSANSQAESTKKFAASEAERMRSEAKAEADSIIARAKEHAQELVSKEAVYIEAQKQAKDAIDKANAQIAELRKVSNQYMDDALRKTEESIEASLKDVKATRAKFNSLAGDNQKTVEKKSVFTDFDID
jgi:cell division septum initiation protein DivIVA